MLAPAVLYERGREKQHQWLIESAAKKYPKKIYLNGLRGDRREANTVRHETSKAHGFSAGDRLV